LALKSDLRIIRDHFLRMIVYLACETLLFLFFKWNPAGFPSDIVEPLERVLFWFVVATVILFTVTCFVLLLRSSLLEVSRNTKEEK
jgi:hypothetical protein